MARPIALLVLAIFAVQAYGQDEETYTQEDRQLVNVDVYYESLCPDSMNFITRQLVPNYEGLKDHINLKLVPFGKASWTEGEGSRPTQFTCQHGPSECRGNQAHSCALHHLAQAYPNDYQQKAVSVIGCVMSAGGSASLVPRCVEKLHVSRDLIARIETCSNNNQGRSLLVENGKLTNDVQKPLQFVPTIVVNGEKNADAFGNFVKAVCDEIPAGDKPNACK